MEADSVGDVSLLESREEIVRCNGVNGKGEACNKFLTKVITYISVDDATRKAMHENNLTLSQVLKGVEVKVGLETKCNRCKQMDYKLKVI